MLGAREEPEFLPRGGPLGEHDADEPRVAGADARDEGGGEVVGPVANLAEVEDVGAVEHGGALGVGGGAGAQDGGVKLGVVAGCVGGAAPGGEEAGRRGEEMGVDMRAELRGEREEGEGGGLLGAGWGRGRAGEGEVVG